MNRNPLLYAKDRLSAIERIENFTSGLDYDHFLIDEKTSSAVIRQLEIIGEAVKKVPEVMTVNYQHIAWKQIAGMRDRLIHFYFGTDYEIIWRTIKERIPELKMVIIEIIEKYDNSQNELHF
jgi:uncharacterized protein with HEPN domain